ncbi:hypothetical protein DFH09DRAFT_1325786 [Mycena vulgaris]|nr:hypothetical protein DFH09DRAFT_1325786 [Mycena vulgaris]
MRFDFVASGRLAAIAPDMLQGQNTDAGKVLRAEMYKLNVYGPGSFFNAHNDTPRSDTMIGSLVLVFPAAHSGGSLGGDVTHAVEPVKTGHRVTLTYNLFLADEHPSPGPNSAPSRSPNAHSRTPSARSLQTPPSCRRADFSRTASRTSTPCPPESQLVDKAPTSRLGPLLRLLKGSDVRIRTFSARTGLETCVKVLYDSVAHTQITGRDVLVDDVLNMDNLNEDYENVRQHIQKCGVLLARDEARERQAVALAKERAKETGGAALSLRTGTRRCSGIYVETKVAIELATNCPGE